MPSTTDSEDSTQITKSEAVELRRIVKGRFDLLREQMSRRADDIRRRIRREILNAHKDRLEPAQAKLDDLQRRAESLVQEGRQLATELKAQGMEVVDDNSRNEFGSYYDLLSVKIRGEVTLRNLDEQVGERMDALASDKGVLDISLRSTELDLLEELSVGQISSKDGKKFLGRIPDLDRLLPMPNGNGSGNQLTEHNGNEQ